MNNFQQLLEEEGKRMSDDTANRILDEVWRTTARILPSHTEPIPEKPEVNWPSKNSPESTTVFKESE